MKISSAELLEFDALKRLLLRYVSSPLGRLEIEKIQPGVDRAAL